MLCICSLSKEVALRNPIKENKPETRQTHGSPEHNKSSQSADVLGQPKREVRAGDHIRQRERPDTDQTSCSGWFKSLSFNC